MLLTAGLSIPAAALAQPKAPSADQRKSAAKAYDRGTSAWLAENYAKAANWYETAYSLAPDPISLVQAVRAHDRAGHAVRAATLSIRLKDRYPDRKRAGKVATKVLDKYASKLARVNVNCDTECTVASDGVIVEHPRFFVKPDVEHEITVSFETGDVTRTVSGAAGETVEIEPEAPAPSAEPQLESDGDTDTEDAVRTPSTRDGSGNGGGTSPSGSRQTELHDEPGEPILTMWVPLSLAVATAASGAALIWSGVDTLDARDEYEDMPTRERFEQGQDKELRTNVLIGSTAVLGVATAVTTVLSAIRREEAPDGSSVQASIRVSRRAAAATVEGRF